MRRISGTEAEHGSQFDRGFETSGGLRIKIAPRARIDRFASEIVRSCVGDINIDVEARTGYFDKCHVVLRLKINHKATMTRANQANRINRV